MLVGTADIEQLAAQAPEVLEFYSEEIVLPQVTCFQLVAEMRNSAREAVSTAEPASDRTARHVGAGVRSG